LNHIARRELEKLGVEGADFIGGIRNELPHETVIDVAGWYEEAGLAEDALSVFALAPDHPVAHIRAAHLLSRLGREREAYEQLAVAGGLPIDGVSPFRRESREALLWAAEKGGSWKFKYFAAVFLAYAGEDSSANELLTLAGDPSDAVFRLFRASRRKGDDRLADLMAAKHASDGWRIGRALANHFAETEQSKNMLEVTTEYIARYPDAHPLKLLHADALLRMGRFRECGEYLEEVTILPAETRGNARELWAKAWEGAARLALALGDISAADTALRKYAQWPENLGAGKPFSDK